jgi:HEPN domain-containing protein/predicted nucleotidyltransferase
VSRAPEELAHSSTLPNEWRELIVKRLAPFEPAQIYVFGSRARGDADPRSDVDVLVVLDGSDGTDDVDAEMRLALREVPVSVELFTATRSDLERVGDSIGSFLYPVLREGVVIHGVDERDERTWLRYAGEDLATAERMTSERGWTPRIACFHAQQAAEKALKAVLVAEKLPPVYSHNLELLRDAIPEGRKSRQVDFDAAWLTGWAVLPRYPGGEPDATPADAQKAVAWARAIVDAARDDIGG